MSAKGGNSFGTFLFSIPLAAIPLMAIFGIPQFGSLGRSPEPVDEFDRPRDDRRHEEDFAYDRSYRRRATDVLRSRGYELDAPAGEYGDRSSSPGHQHGERDDDRQPWPDAPVDNGTAEERFAAASAGRMDADPRPMSEFDRRSLQQDVAAASYERPEPAPSATSTTWQSAARQLEDLGISSYHLEPGSEAGSFLFVCSFCPQTSPNVTMRFEAEAIEPLDAVDDVLAQIDHWQRQQTQ